MKFDVKKVTEWKAPEKVEAPDAHIICMPNVPKQLQGPGCLEGCAEVLTPDGWKRIDSISKGDLVMCWQYDGEKLTFQNVQDTTKVFCDRALLIGYEKAKNFDMLYSPEHRIPLEYSPYRHNVDGRRVFYKKDERPKKLSVVTAQRLPKKQTEKKFFSAGYGASKDDQKLSPEERLFIAIQADGHLLHTNKKSPYNVFEIWVKKIRKISQLTKILEACTIRWRRLPDQNGYVGFRIWTVENPKLFSNVFSYGMSKEKAASFISELVEWDGYVGTHQPGFAKKPILRRSYCSNNYDNICFVQAIAAQAGLTTLTTKREYPERKVHHPTWNIEFREVRRRGATKLKKEEVEYNNYMYCITVPTSFFLVKYKENIMITGNCQPRTIFGKSTWDHMRRRCYFLADYKCQCCGREVGKDIEKRQLAAHELFSYDFKAGTARFKQCVALCHLCHTQGGVHSGRAYTMYKKGSPFMTGNMVLEGAKHAFSLVHKWNIKHPDEEPLRLYATWVQFAKDKNIGEDICSLIDKYDIKFYGPTKDQAKWEDWRLIIGEREYPTPYKSEQEWEQKMEELNKKMPNDERSYKDPFTGGVYDEIKKVLKNS